jgi:hypothetical protein
MSSGAPRIVSAQRMESIFRHGIEYFPEIDLRSGYQQVRNKELGMTEALYLGHVIKCIGCTGTSRGKPRQTLKNT